VLVAGILIYESIHRIMNIESVSGTAIMIVAAAAFVMNSLVAVLLYGHRHDLNIRSAFLHMVTDAGISLGVLVAGAVIATTGWYYADPVAALVVSAFILYAAWGIIREATDVLLESVPRHIDLIEVERTIKSVEGVEAVHHLHVWELGSGVYAMSGHVEVEDKRLSECSGIVDEINRILQEDFNIVHPTLQMECATCPPADCKPTGGRQLNGPGG
jgi:cobalt-zinc-cadmium efflux system protein